MNWITSVLCACILLHTFSEICTHGAKQKPQPIKFSLEVEKSILDSLAACESDPALKIERLMMVKEGNYSRDPEFMDFIFCSCTRSGYADEHTGRVFVEHTASVYPEQCNMIEILKYCDKNARGDSPKTMLFDFFVCFQENTKCRIDLLPNVPTNITTPIVTIKEPTKSFKKPQPIKFSLEVEKSILDSLAACESDPALKIERLMMVKEGNYSRDPEFMDFIFCSYTRSGYADEHTGRVFVEHTASLYPEQCNMIEILKYCDKNARGDSPKTMLFDFFVCFQENTKCRIDLLPNVPTNITTPIVTIKEPTKSFKKPQPIKFSLEVEKSILDSLAACESDPALKIERLMMVKEGNYSRDPEFMDFIFCSYTRSGYADEHTGRVFVEHTASLYPEQCMIEILKYCDKNARGDSPKTMLFDFFVCFQENTKCRIDLLPNVPTNITTPIVTIKEPTKSFKKPKPVKFSLEVEKSILDSLAECESDPALKIERLMMVKEGNFSRDPDFIDFIFCSYTKSGYADEHTGRVFVEHTASVYPEHCNMIEILKYCDKNARGDSPKTMLFDFFVCFQENTKCRIDLLPAIPRNTDTTSVSFEESLKTLQEPVSIKFTAQEEKHKHKAIYHSKRNKKHKKDSTQYS